MSDAAIVGKPFAVPQPPTGWEGYWVPDWQDADRRVRVICGKLEIAGTLELDMSVQEGDPAWLVRLDDGRLAHFTVLAWRFEESGLPPTPCLAPRLDPLLRNWMPGAPGGVLLGLDY